MVSEPTHYLSLMGVSAKLKRCALTPTGLTETIMARIARHDGPQKSYTTLLADRAMAKAREAEDELKRGFWRGHLHGVPIAVKDLCYTDYAPTAAGMLIQRTSFRLTPAPSWNVLLQRDHLGQADDDRGCIRGSSSKNTDTDQSLECRRLDRCVFERVRNPDGGRTVLRVARLRYWTIDPIPVSSLRADGS
jgi:hypothetical protein